MIILHNLTDSIMLSTYKNLIPDLGAFSTNNGIGKTPLFGVFNFMKKEYWKNTDLKDLPKEKWKDIPDYEGYYRASNLGRIKSLPRIVPSNMIKGVFNRRRERILKQKLTQEGYLAIVLQVDKQKKHISAHRCIAVTFHPNPLSLPQINHKDFDRTNNVSKNLEWGTAKYNINYTIDAGRFNNGAGEKNIKNILTEAQVIEIRKNWVMGKIGQRKELSKKYGVSESAVAKIGLRQNWKHLNT